MCSKTAKQVFKNKLTPASRRLKNTHMEDIWLKGYPVETFFLTLKIQIPDYSQMGFLYDPLATHTRQTIQTVKVNYTLRAHFVQTLVHCQRPPREPLAMYFASCNLSTVY